MSIRIGSMVRFLNEKGGGVVTRFGDKQTAYVDVDGFEIPFLLDQLILVQTDIVFSEGEQKTEEIQKEALFLIIEPDHELDILQNELSVYLLNSTSYHLLYTYSLKEGNYYQTVKQGESGPFQRILLKKFALRFLKEFAYHKLEVLFFKKQPHFPQLPCTRVIYLNEQVLGKGNTIPHHDFDFNVWAFTLKDDFMEGRKIMQQLTDYDKERLLEVKEFKVPMKKSVPHHHLAYTIDKEVDLHIEKVVDHYKGMSNYEMLQLQLQKFQKHLEEAIVNKYHKIVFIHGVGNGRLKQEITGILEGYKKEVKFYDAEYKKYGMGATEVIILRS